MQGCTDRKSSERKLSVLYLMCLRELFVDQPKFSVEQSTHQLMLSVPCSFVSKKEAECVMFSDEQKTNRAAWTRSMDGQALAVCCVRCLDCIIVNVKNERNHPRRVQMRAQLQSIANLVSEWKQSLPRQTTFRTSPSIFNWSSRERCEWLVKVAQICVFVFRSHQR